LEKRTALWFIPRALLSGISDIVLDHCLSAIVSQLIRGFCADDHTCGKWLHRPQNFGSSLQ
jgi:hypothetical protein